MKILIGGDYVPIGNIAKMMETGDFSYFDEVKHITEKADFSIVNLEAPIVVSDAEPIAKCGPNLKTSKEVIDSLRYAGVDMVTLANNHIMDYGYQGLNDTIKNLDSGGILHIGTGDNIESAKKIKYIDIKKKRLAIINCCEHESSIASESTSGANPLNSISQYYAIKEAKQDADFILLIVHGGHELWQLPSPRMVETYRFFIDAGADAVVNHHQHCFSGYELYNGKPIFYGIGNLCFERAVNYDTVWNFGYLVLIDFSDSISFEIFPYSQCKGVNMVKMLPDNYFDKDIIRLNSIIENPKLLLEKTNKYYDRYLNTIQHILEPYSNKFTSKLFNMGLLPSCLRGDKFLKLRNYIECESHRDKLLHNVIRINKS